MRERRGLVWRVAAAGALGVVLAGGLALRAYRLGERSLWFDEAVSYTSVTRFSWPEMIERTGQAVHPPFYYVCLRLWTRSFGTSEVGMRSLSVLLGLLAVAGVYLFCRDAFADSWEEGAGNCELGGVEGANRAQGESPSPQPSPASGEGAELAGAGEPRRAREARSAGLIAAALLATSGFQIAWSQQARMYALGTALAALSSWMLVRALRGGIRRAAVTEAGAERGGEARPAVVTSAGSGNPRRARLVGDAERPTVRARAERGHEDGAGGWWWTGYALTAAAFLYTHNYALFAVFAQGLFAAGFLLARHRCDLGAVVRSRSFWYACAAVAAVCLLYAPWLGVLREQTARVKTDYWVGPMNAWTLPNAWFSLFYPQNERGAPPRLAAAAVCMLLGLVLAALAIKRRPGDWLTLLLVVVPVGCAAGISLVSAPIVLDRYFTFAHVFALCAIARVVSWAPWRDLRYGLTAALVANGLFAHSLYWSALELDRRPGVRAAVEHVLARRSANEPLVVVHPAIFQSVSYYLGDRSQACLFATHALSHYNGGPLVLADDILGPWELERLPNRKVWVFDSTGYRTTFARFALPASWEEVPGSRLSFPEPQYFQGDILVARYARQEKP